MNGAEALVESLAGAGVEACFANPGTSEMQLVAAIGRHPTMRAVLGLFEGVVTGAADGYGRMADKPAMTLLHLGPGLANGCANLHNARRARTPVVNIVGDHAVAHLALDAPLTSDVTGIAKPVSDWVATSASPENLAACGVEAYWQANAYPGKVATVIAPADHTWTQGAQPVSPRVPSRAPVASDDAVSAAAEALKSGKPTALFLGGRALRAEALAVAGDIATATEARLIAETFPARLQRGEGRAIVETLPYFGEQAVDFLKGLNAIVLIGAPAPVSFFAYPDKPSWLAPESGALLTLATAREDALDALTRLRTAMGVAPGGARLQSLHQPASGEGLTPATIGAVLARLSSDDTIVVDEAVTSGGPIFAAMAGARRHDWLSLTGGAIGQGLPLAVGAAVACPDRKVIALQADGSGMYTLQALWTMAREDLDVTVIIFNNGSYAILNHELVRVGAEAAGAKGRSLLDLTRPAIDWASLAIGMGVPAVRVETLAEFSDAAGVALRARGPRLIEVILSR